MSTNPPPVDTKHCSDRRPLRFDSLADVRRDLEALEQACGADTLRYSGNWTPGEIYTHLAAFINYAYDGYPPGFPKPPAIIKLILKLQKKKFLHKGLPAGVKIPGVPGGTVGAEKVPPAAGLARLRAALDRLERHAPTAPNIIFGPLTHEEWRCMHQRHCELHLSYLHPK